jgi:hypothetical protein
MPVLALTAVLDLEVGRVKFRRVDAALRGQRREDHH